MADISAAGRFGQFDDHVRIDLASLERGMIIGIATGIADKGKKEENQDYRNGTAKVRFLHCDGQHHVGLHVEAVGKRAHGS